MKKQTGFTLIELIMVILILGVLAATAIPRFYNLQADARIAATQGVAGALGAASAINFAVRSFDAARGVAIANCTGVASALEGGLPAGYTIDAAAIANGATETCTVNGPGATTANFIGHGIS